tara:strand:- start:54 stop:290 length:237 start_codon:yes stop_codon:yes gene_type:complete
LVGGLIGKRASKSTDDVLAVYHENAIGAKSPKNKVASSFFGFTIFGDVLIEIRNEKFVKPFEEHICKWSAVHQMIESN